MRRDFGLDLFMDRERLRVRALFGSLTDDAFVSTRPDAAAAGLVGRCVPLGRRRAARARRACSPARCAALWHAQRGGRGRAEPRRP